MQTNNKDSKVIKLSPKQKEVIRLMREGHQFNIGGCYGISMTWSEQKQLCELGVVKNINPFVYELTELGKTIDIN